MVVHHKTPSNSSIDKYVSLLVHTNQSHICYSYKEKCFFLTFLSFFLSFSLSLSKDMLEVFEAIQGKFQQIRYLTRRQKDHLKRFYGGNDAAKGNIEVYLLLIIPLELHKT